MDEWWLDEELADRRQAYVEALARWDEVRSSPDDVDAEMSGEQHAAMKAAMKAEEAYVARRDELRQH